MIAKIIYGVMESDRFRQNRRHVPNPTFMGCPRNDAHRGGTQFCGECGAKFVEKARVNPYTEVKPPYKYYASSGNVCAYESRYDKVVIGICLTQADLDIVQVTNPTFKQHAEMLEYLTTIGWDFDVDGPLLTYLLTTEY